MCEVLDRIENKGRMEDAKRAANDEAFQRKILEEFRLIRVGEEE